MFLEHWLWLNERHGLTVKRPCRDRTKSPQTSLSPCYLGPTRAIIYGSGAYAVSFHSFKSLL